MSIAQDVKEFIETWSGLDINIPVDVDSNMPKPVWYSISPTPSNPVIETDITGREKKQFTFTFQSNEYTVDILRRLENCEFFEQLGAWFKAQTDTGNLPAMDTGQTPLEIEAQTWGYLVAEGESGTGIYQIQCRLVYRE